MEKLCSKCGEDQSINEATTLPTDAEHVSDFIFDPMICIALDRQIYGATNPNAQSYSE